MRRDFYRLLLDRIPQVDLPYIHLYTTDFDLNIGITLKENSHFGL